MLSLELEVTFEEVLALLGTQLWQSCQPIEESAQAGRIPKSQLLVEVAVPQVDVLRVGSEDIFKEGTTSLRTSLLVLQGSEVGNHVQI